MRRRVLERVAIKYVTLLQFLSYRFYSKSYDFFILRRLAVKNIGLRFILDAVLASNIRSSRYRIFLFNDNSGETDMYNADRNRKLYRMY